MKAQGVGRLCCSSSRPLKIHPHTSNISSIWERVRNAGSRASLQTHGIRTCLCQYLEGYDVSREWVLRENLGKKADQWGSSTQGWPTVPVVQTSCSGRAPAPESGYMRVPGHGSRGEKWSNAHGWLTLAGSTGTHGLSRCITPQKCVEQQPSMTKQRLRQ